MPAKSIISSTMACLKEATRAITRCTLTRVVDEQALLLTDDASQCTSSVDLGTELESVLRPLHVSSLLRQLAAYKDLNVSLALHDISRLKPIHTVQGQNFLEKAVSVVRK